MMMMMMNYFCGMVDDDDGELFLWNGSPTNDKWWIVFVEWLTDERRLALFPTGTIVKDPHHLQSPTQREQDLSLHKTWV